MSFENLGLNKEIIGKLAEQGISTPTTIQEQAIPVLLKGTDVIGRAETGSGKTLAFLLPILQKMDVNAPYIQALIVTPTRELAIQITEEVKKMIPDSKDVQLLAAYGGQDVEKQLNKLKKGVHIVVGTPGRLLDHVRRGTLQLGHLKMLVLDEADQMLHFGFLEDVETLIGSTPKTRQTMLFSATMPDQVRALSRRFMKQPKDILIQEAFEKKPDIKQMAIETTDRQKFDKLCQIIDQFRPYLALVFCRTKRRASQLNENLLGKGYMSDELHGDLSQAKRERVMKRFRDAEIQILVATDVAARGLDVQGVTHVINYDLPGDVQGYIHRIGRTGRAGESGLAITFVGQRDQQEFLRLSRAVGGQISWKKLDGTTSEEPVTEDRKPRKPSAPNDRKGRENKRENKRENTRENKRETGPRGETARGETARGETARGETARGKTARGETEVGRRNRTPSGKARANKPNARPNSNQPSKGRGNRRSGR